MTAFAHIRFPDQHPGVVRAERTFEWAASLPESIDGARATATVLLAAIVSALLVVANQVVDTWTEGHLLAAWIVLWTIGFAALALLALPARRAGQALRTNLAAWNQVRAQRHHDRKYWEVALTDARVMAEISRAMSQSAVRDARYY